MPAIFRRRIFWIVTAGVVLTTGLVVYFLYPRPRPLPEPGSDRYEQFVDAFMLGTAALDTGALPDVALENLNKAIELVPEEPAALGNRALHYLRQNQLSKAEADLRLARKLAPDHPNIGEMLSVLAEKRGKEGEAITQLRKVLEQEPGNVRRLYKLNQLLAKDGGDSALTERFALYDQMLKLRPNNLPLLAERAALAARNERKDILRDTFTRMKRLAPSWMKSSRNELAAAIASEKVVDVVPLGNVLKVEPGYTRDAEEINPPDVGTSFLTFLRLAPLKPTPAPADTGLTLAESALPGDEGDLVVPLWPDGKAHPNLFIAGSDGVRLRGDKDLRMSFPSGEKKLAPSPAGVLVVDWNNDKQSDFVLAGAGGVKVYRNDGGKGFSDVTANTKLPPDIQGADYYGAWAADIDMDGDLDILLARRSGDMVLLRNNFDGTFTAQPIFPEVKAARDFTWADLDNDGGADAAIVDADGKLHVFMNRRSGVFEQRRNVQPMSDLAALTAADINDDGTFDIVGVTTAGGLVGLDVEGKQVLSLGRLPDAVRLIPGETRMQAIDLDGNGAADFVVRTASGGRVFLAREKGIYEDLGTRLPGGFTPVLKLDDQAPLSIVGRTAGQGGLKRFDVRGTKGYAWLELRAIAAERTEGDNRINSFAIGSEVEVRSGLLVTKQRIEYPVVVIGLGTRTRASVMRFVWTNGTAQMEFNRDTGSVVSVLQRLKGSCPFLFSHDGEHWVFVTDFCWSTPLGMYINAQAPTGFVETTDYVRIPPEVVRAQQGRYQLRVNATLWETIYLDHLALKVVHHPPGTEIHVDERFFLTPTKARYFVTGPSRPVRRALDHRGADVTEIVRTRDGNYLDRAGRGLYQGITSDHWVEIDLSDWVGTEGPVYILAHGWLHPTDSSINFAMEQGNHVRPMPLILEVFENGTWRAVGPPLGFPAGKNKTMVIRVDGTNGVPARVRLRTNLEIFWDALHVAQGRMDPVREHTLNPRSADLSYRGILRITQANASSPEIAHDTVVSTGGHYRDLVGFHTRFGDVQELLTSTDDRFVIMNAGDEIHLQFDTEPTPPTGWLRSFVWVSDGWTKDGDLNTRFGDTVLPLPYHGMRDYQRTTRLQDDPVYRRFPRDWERFHTRYVAPVRFQRGLRGSR